MNRFFVTVMTLAAVALLAQPVCADLTFTEGFDTNTMGPGGYQFTENSAYSAWTLVGAQPTTVCAVYGNVLYNSTDASVDAYVTSQSALGLASFGNHVTVSVDATNSNASYAGSGATGLRLGNMVFMYYPGYDSGSTTGAYDIYKFATEPALDGASWTRYAMTGYVPLNTSTAPGFEHPQHMILDAVENGANWTVTTTFEEGGATKWSNSLSIADADLTGGTSTITRVGVAAVSSTWTEHMWDNFQVTAVGASVPEPGALVLLGTGLIGLLCYAWRRRKMT